MLSNIEGTAITGIKIPGIVHEFSTIPNVREDLLEIFLNLKQIVLSSKNNPVVEVRFKDLFPLSLTGLAYNQQETDINYLTATVTFDYLNYEFATPNSSTTTVTTS